MRHNKKFNHLGRKSAHRKAMLANMATSLIMHKRIETTVAKARALKIYVEPLMTKSKNDTTHSRRVVFSYLRDKYAVTELFREISTKIADRPGGYTRILKLGNRQGDNAEMCIIELVDYNENMLKDAGKGGAKKTRRRRGGSKAKGAETTTKVEETASTEAVEAETATEEKPKAKKAAPKKAEETAATEEKPKAKAAAPKKAEKEDAPAEEKPKAEKAAPKKAEKEDTPAEEKPKAEKAAPEKAEKKDEEPKADASKGDSEK
ncbi:MAG: 50S ribosomal protein L17 [Bacteroidales bacterium]